MSQLSAANQYVLGDTPDTKWRCFTELVLSYKSKWLSTALPYQSYHLPQCGKQQNLQEQSSLQRWHKLHAVSFCQLVSWKMINVIDFFNTSIVLTIIPCQIESLCSSWGDWLAVFQSQQGCIHLLHHSIPAQTHLFLNMTLIRKYSSEA